MPEITNSVAIQARRRRQVWCRDLLDMGQLTSPADVSNALPNLHHTAVLPSFKFSQPAYVYSPLLLSESSSIRQVPPSSFASPLVISAHLSPPTHPSQSPIVHASHPPGFAAPPRTCNLPPLWTHSVQARTRLRSRQLPDTTSILSFLSNTPCCRRTVKSWPIRYGVIEVVLVSVRRIFDSVCEATSAHVAMGCYA